jgi:hypothetical protein
MTSMPRIARFATILALSLSAASCLHQARVERNRAEADRAEAQAELARAQAAAIRNGEAPAEGEYVAGDAEPQPPPAVVEIAPPPPSAVHIWIVGCHEWRHGGWVWVPGHWAVPPRAGAMWVHGHWRRRPHGWVWVSATWR